MSFWSTFLDLVLPRYCVICGKELCETEHDLCNCCLLKIHPVEWKFLDDNLILRNLWEKHDVEMAGSMLHYNHGQDLNRIFYEIKYRGRPGLGKRLSETSFQYWQEMGLADGVNYIIPVPLHWRRLLRRGYNQSEWIARGIANITKIPVKTDVLERFRYNRTQTHKTRELRYESTKGIFRVRKRRRTDLDGKTVLLVDDIVTTGSTISDCIRALREVFPTVKVRIFSLGCTGNV